MAERVTSCTVDGTAIGSGGSKSAGLCARCYARKRRGGTPSAAHGRAPNGAGQAANFNLRLAPSLRARVEVLAGQLGVALSEWIREAVEEKLERQAKEKAL